MKQAPENNATEGNELLRNDYFIKRVARRFLINSVLSMVFLYAASMIDTLLVGAFLGEEGLGAMSLVSPVYLLFYTVGATLGTGGSISASQALGRGDVPRYKQLYTFSTVAVTAAAVLMCIIFYAFSTPILKLLSNGAGPEELAMARAYLLFYIPGGAMTMISYIPLYFLKTDGRPKASFALFAMSSLINIVLTWLFMSPAVNLGIAGAALATSISMAAVVAVGFIILPRRGSELRFVRLSALEKGTLKRVSIAGVPNGLSNLMESARILLVNRLLLFIGAAAFLSCYTVVRNITDILSAVMIGISSAMLPLIGVFYGEEDYVSERQVFRIALKDGILMMLPPVVLVSVIPVPLFRLFGVTDAGVLTEGAWALPLASFGLIAAYVNTLYTGYLTAIKREKLATLLVVCRLFLILAVIAVCLAFTVGSKGIWLSLSLAEIATLLLFFAIRRGIRRKNPDLDRLLLDTSKQTGNDISFSVRNELSEIMYASEHIEGFCLSNDIDPKKSMKISLAIEEILTFLINYCVSRDAEYYTDIRVHKMENGVMMRFRYVGGIFNPLRYYTDNRENEQMQEDLLGLKLIIGSAVSTDFRQTLGANNLIIIF